MKAEKFEGHEEQWLRTVCDMCYTSCGIIARRVNGVVVEVRGDPDFPNSRGKLCAKGKAGPLALYDPYRMMTPLKRTNPQKGIGVNPNWQEISWEEALETVAARLREVREEDRRRLFHADFDQAMLQLAHAWASAFGSPNSGLKSAGYYCGAALHQMTSLTNASFHSEIDLDYCNYCLLIGNQKGFMAGVNPNINTQKMAEARSRGMKLVVIDPQCCNAAAKADEWIPIRPGTDGALALAMLNVLLNEVGIYDREFLRAHTNGSYLVKPGGCYLRDEATGKPLVWDLSDGRAKPYDSQAGELALEGAYQVNGTECQPAFQRLKEHVKKYTPEGVSPITTVPAETIRRIALEFGQAARVGAKITIEGKEFPFRPAAVNQYRGAYSHKHGTHTALAIQLLNLVIGGLYVPGSYRGHNAVGPYWSVKEGRDGLLMGNDPEGMAKDPYSFYGRQPGVPQSLNMAELFPVAWGPSPSLQLAVIEPERYKLPFKAEVLLHCRSNVMMTTADVESMAETLRKVPFQVSFAREMDETVEFADIVFPELHYLEKLDPFPHNLHVAMSPSTGHWFWGLRQPAADPPAGPRHWGEVLLELAERAGFLEDLYTILNVVYEMREPFKLHREKKYTWEEIADLKMKSRFGPDHGLAWFMEHGYLTFQRKVEEVYPFHSIKPRIPIYFEHYLEGGQFAKKTAEILGLPWDICDYEPLPNWRPCPAYGDETPGFDLYVVNTTLPFHTYTITPANPWLDELSQHHPYAYKIMINSVAAQKKGIGDGDLIWVESPVARVKGQAKVTECIHPEVVGIAGVFGGWSQGTPVRRGKGAHFNSLIPFSLERIDPLSNGLDACVKVRVYKAERE